MLLYGVYGENARIGAHHENRIINGTDGMDAGGWRSGHFGGYTACYPAFYAVSYAEAL